MNWYDDLCEYFDVSKEEVIELSTRKTGRRPNLPGSATCEPVSGKNFEELWDEKPRETLQQKMDFWKDIGSWQVFRQCNYRSKFNYNPYYADKVTINAPFNFLEYGCGVGPFTNHIVENAPKEFVKRCKFVLVDVAGEHLEFAKWRLNKKAPDSFFQFHHLTAEYNVPTFTCDFDIVSIMDVYEHLPNPLEVTNNFFNHMNDGARLIETWVKHENPERDNLMEAFNEKEEVMKFLNENFVLNKKGSVRVRTKK